MKIINYSECLYFVTDFIGETYNLRTSNIKLNEGFRIYTERIELLVICIDLLFVFIKQKVI